MLMKTRVGVEREGWSVMRVGGAELERVMGDGRWETGDGRWWETVRWGGRQELSRIFRCGGRGEWWWVMTVKARCW